MEDGALASWKENRTVSDFIARSKQSEVVEQSRRTTPNYWTSPMPDPESLLSASDIHSLNLGTGAGIYSALLPAVEAANHEVILVTCFWARSATLNMLNTSLRALSNKGKRIDRKIRVRICFSSSSLFQKLFHTFSLQGQTYMPSTWCSKLGLPPQAELEGLDMEVKSVFVLPFSVMHPKFILIDRQRAFLPSCNVSWEDWFEACVELSGPIVLQFSRFWRYFWATDGRRTEDQPLDDNTEQSSEIVKHMHPGLIATRELELPQVPSIFLLSPHHRNPRFTLPWRVHSAPPPTPLNTFMLSLLANAKRSVYTQTPNLTAPPVLSALLAALGRGVNVRLVTSERLMILEQLVTAGTTTTRCVNKLRKRHQRLVKHWATADVGEAEAGEAGKPGRLQIDYFRSPHSAATGSGGTVQSHLKLTIVDDEIMILGSGNMDRASWYTSQELDVALFSVELVKISKIMLEDLLSNRTNSAYDSEHETRK